MKTTYFIAIALFLSSMASAQKAEIRSKTSTNATVAGSQSGTSAKGSIQSTTEVKADADPNPTVQSGGLEHKNNSGAAVSATQDNKNSTGTSINTTNNASGNVLLTEPVTIKKSANSAVNQSVAASGNVVAGTNQSVRTKSSGAVAVSQSATKNVQAKAKKSARVKANTDASVNTQIRPVPVKTSSMISTGAGLRL